MSNSLNHIQTRANQYTERHPSPVVLRKVADQMHADILHLLAYVETLKAAP